ncbi:MAG: lytic transglycosylase domain-containing protein [Thermodesulfobacteriota bacterium]|nr:lytic transglycosylase domain-containing protein [Thermodesulfobacteriota bacterium]
MTKLLKTLTAEDLLMGLYPFSLPRLCFLCTALGLFHLWVPSLQASRDTSQGEVLSARVGIINHTPSFELEVTIDGQGPSVIGKGQTKTVFLDDKESPGTHQLKARAYVPSKHLDRCQIGKELTIMFQMTGAVEDSPAGKVGWHKVFTHRDFFPHLESFPPARRKAKPKGLGRILSEGYSLSTYEARSQEQQIHGLIRWASEKYRIPLALLKAVIEVESGFNVRAVSRKGAQGLMQLMPATCARFGVQRPFDAQENVEGGSKYLNYLLHDWSLRFPSSRRLALCLAAYHAGEGRVEQYGGVPPIKETRDYVREVLRRYRSWEKT